MKKRLQTFRKGLQWGTMPHLVKREEEGNLQILQDLIRIIEMHKISLNVAPLFHKI